MNRTIYIKDKAKLARWKEYARQNGISFSHLVELALRDWVERQAPR